MDKEEEEKKTPPSWNIIITGDMKFSKPAELPSEELKKEETDKKKK